VSRIRFGNKHIQLPRNRLVRMGIGIFLVLLGFLGFLPVLGFWMIPLGLMVLSVDIPVVRRLNRRVSVAVKRWWTGVRSRRRTSQA
jgi:hypothetical protein